MQKLRTLLWENRRVRYALLSFFSALVSILFVFLVSGFYPFGNKTLLSMDAWSQYFPMLVEGQNGTSLWSFSGGLGFNRLAELAYYAMSPLNYIVYLFPRSGMYLVLHLVILLRFALAGLTLSLFLSERYRPHPLSLFFAPAYALCGFALAFINQFMWMDAVVLCPLVALGIFRIVTKGRPLLYVLSLAATLFSCFYIGYMVCLFSVLYFLLLLPLQEKGTRAAFRSVGIFALFSLLAGGLAAGTLLPTFLALQETVAAGLTFTGELKLYHSFLDILSRFLPFRPLALAYEAPNLYCGAIALILFLVAAFLPKRKWQARLSVLFLAAFIYFSVNLNLLDFIWHGLHYPNQLPGRQTFLFAFLILAEAYGVLLSLAVASPRRYRLLPRLAAFSVAGLLLAEVLANGAVCVNRDTWWCDINSYVYWDEEMEDIAARYSDGAWRSEKINCFNFNAPQLYRYNGLSFYSSTMKKQDYDFFLSLGMEVYAQNVSTLYVPSNILNMLFGVRYLHAYNGDEIGTLYADKCETVGKVTVWENRYCLPLAFAASDDAVSANLNGYRGAAKQEEMLRLLLGAPDGTHFYGETALSNAYDTLSAGGLHVTKFEKDHIEGYLVAEENSFLFTSIAYDAGWTVKIDGKTAPTFALFDTLLAAPCEAGVHTVTLSYTPRGFTAGLLLSAGSALAVGLWVFLAERQRTR